MRGDRRIGAQHQTNWSASRNGQIDRAADIANRKRFAVFAPLYTPAVLGGGPIRTLKALVTSAPPEIATFVFTENHDLGQLTPLTVSSDMWSENDGVPVYYCGRTKSAYLHGLRAIRKLRPLVVYHNSFFSAKSSLIPQVIGKLGFWRGATVLLAPRGELSKGALAIRTVKKRLAIKAYKALGLHRHVLWHASSEFEASDIRSVFGSRCRIIVREDETTLPLAASCQSKMRSGVHSLQIVFVSRLNPMKGLDLLLQSLLLSTANVVLDVYGNAEDKDYVQNCEGLIAQLPDNVKCTLHGPIRPEKVRQTFADGDLFVFPTSGENFGHVIAEALSVSCPIICSDLTPWSDVLRRAGGDVVHGRAPRNWASAIASFAGLSTEEVEARRRAAGAAYNEWRRAEKGSHVFTALRDDFWTKRDNDS